MEVAISTRIDVVKFVYGKKLHSFSVAWPRRRRKQGRRRHKPEVTCLLIRFSDAPAALFRKYGSETPDYTCEHPGREPPQRDSYGDRAPGGQCLTNTAKRLQCENRRNHFVVRVGGDDHHTVVGPADQAQGSKGGHIDEIYVRLDRQRRADPEPLAGLLQRHDVNLSKPDLGQSDCIARPDPNGADRAASRACPARVAENR